MLGYSEQLKTRFFLICGLKFFQGELAYTNEKLMLSESVMDTLKTKLAELLSEAEEISER